MLANPQGLANIEAERERRVQMTTVLKGGLVGVAALLSMAVPGAATQPQRGHRVQIVRLLGPGRRLREFVDFRTERGEAAALVLFVTNIIHDVDETQQLEEVLTCPDEVPGIGLEATYHLALVISGRLINELVIPSPSEPADAANPTLFLPVRHLRSFNASLWGQELPLRHDNAKGDVVEPTRLIKLADFNGDGRRWEFRLLQPGNACCHRFGLIAGYSAQQRRAIIFPVFEGPRAVYWEDNVFPHPDDARGGRLTRHYECGDHGNTVDSLSEFVYDPKREAWVLDVTRSKDCERRHKPTPTSVEVPTPSTPVVLRIATVRGTSGQRVTVPITLDAHGAKLSSIEFSVADEPQMPFATNADGGDRCEIVAQGYWYTGFSAVGPIACASERASSCSWAWSGDLELRPEAAIPDSAALYTCEVQIPRGAPAGSYPLRIVKVNARAPNRDGVKIWPDDEFGDRNLSHVVPAIGADGGVVVDGTR